VNGDVFHSKYKDFQLSSLFNGLPLTQNAASGRSYGAELEVTARLSGFGFTAGLGYLKAEFASDTTIVNTLTNLPQLVHEGDKLPFAPGLTLNAGLDYSYPMALGTLVPRIQWSRVSEQLATPFVSSASIVPAHQTADARLTFNADGGWLVEGYVSNFTDSTYIAAQLQNSSSATGGILYGAPRQYGLRFAVNFGK
jgi:iron complex outermembrane receptor protein